MFKKPFSFKGRIRRIEYGISQIVVVLCYNLLAYFLFTTAGSDGAELFLIVPVYFFLFWFLLAQNTKRCHDLGKNGWWQIIPFYSLWMLFASGVDEANEYGANPKNS